MTTEPLGAPEQPEPHARERRIAVLPIALAAGGVLLAGVFALVIAGLAASAPVAVPSPSPSATPSIPAPAAVEPVPTEAPRPGAGPNECVDARGDGAGIDLDSVALSVEDDRLRAVFVLTEPLGDGDASLEIYADGISGRYQLATVWSDGKIDEFFAYRLSDAPSEDDENERDDEDDNRGPGSNDRDEYREGQRSDLKKRDVTNEGTVVIATFPLKILDGLGDDFLWYASATADHDAADACYQPDGTLVPFTRCGRTPRR
jgi:hypothetical protein